MRYEYNDLWRSSGLEDPYEFAKKRREQNYLNKVLGSKSFNDNDESYLDRQTGKTTRRIMEHILKLLNNEESYFIARDAKCKRYSVELFETLLVVIHQRNPDFWKSAFIINNYYIYSRHEEYPYLMTRTLENPESYLIEDLD